MSSAPPDRPRFTRRHFMVAAGSVASTVGLIGGAALLAQPKTRVVGYRAAYDDDLVGMLREGFRAFPRLVTRIPGANVVLKPNLVEVHPDRPINTDPRLVAAAAQAFLEEGARSVVVAEGPGHMRDTEAILAFTGLEERLRPLRVPYVDLNVDEAVDVPLAHDFTGLHKLPVAQTVMQADLFVSMPKMKTHHWAGVTLSMKNLFGTVPSSVVGWPKNPLHWAGIIESVLDLWAAVEPDFTIVDGIVGMEGDGPILGSAVDHGVLLLGENLPAVDATAMRLMGLKPEIVPTLFKTLGKGGTFLEPRIERVGDELPVRAYGVLPQFDFLKA